MKKKTLANKKNQKTKMLEIDRLFFNNTPPKVKKIKGSKANVK